MNIEGTDFNVMYKDIIQILLENPENKIINRKGKVLHEDTTAIIRLENIDNPYAFCRNLNLTYLIGELLFYLKGENKLANIVKYSKFWEKVSDDGENLNSCYGYYIWKRIAGLNNTNNETNANLSQFDYCLSNLIQNINSKKAVITIYEGGLHSYKTNDNPCTMYLQFLIRNDKLNMIVNMRSNDIWFGLPYDLPFFCFVMKMMYYQLQETYSNLKLGHYTHISNSLHLYQKDFEKVKDIFRNKPMGRPVLPTIDKEFFKQIDIFKHIEDWIPSERQFTNIHPFTTWSLDILRDHYKEQKEKKEKKASFCFVKNYDPMFFKYAKKEAENSNCLKKKVGCIVVKNGEIVAMGFGGRSSRQGKCEECKTKKETFYHDTCNSIHSEERAILGFYKNKANGNYNPIIRKYKNLEGADVYLTHGPCDQCMKFLIEEKIANVFYEVPYKTDFTRYKGLIDVYECPEEDNYRRII